MVLSHIFPRVVLAAIGLVGGALELEGFGLEPGVSWGISSISDQHIPFGCGVSPHAARAEVLRIKSTLSLFPLCVRSLLPALAPLS